MIFILAFAAGGLIFTSLTVSCANAPGGDGSNSSSGSSAPKSLPFHDDFNRPANSAVGNGWTEGEGNGDSGTFSELYIMNNELVCRGGYSSGTSATYMPAVNLIITINTNTKTTIIFHMDSGSTMYFNLMDVSYCYEFEITGSDISIHRNGGTLASDTYSFFNTSHTNICEITKASNTLTLKLTDNNNSSTKSISAVDGSPFDSFSKIVLGGGYFGGSALNTYVDDFKIEAY